MEVGFRSSGKRVEQAPVNLSTSSQKGISPVVLLREISIVLEKAQMLKKGHPISQYLASKQAGRLHSEEQKGWVDPKAINFIWMGPPPKDSEEGTKGHMHIIGPLSCCDKQRVNYFCDSQYVEYYKELFSKHQNIKVISIEECLKNEERDEKNKLAEEFFKLFSSQAQCDSSWLGNRYLITLKDVATLLLTRKYKGYFFDTNVIVRQELPAVEEEAGHRFVSSKHKGVFESDIFAQAFNDDTNINEHTVGRALICMEAIFAIYEGCEEYLSQDLSSLIGTITLAVLFYPLYKDRSLFQVDNKFLPILDKHVSYNDQIIKECHKTYIDTSSKATQKATQLVKDLDLRDEFTALRLRISSVLDGLDSRELKKCREFVKRQLHFQGIKEYEKRLSSCYDELSMAAKLGLSTENMSQVFKNAALDDVNSPTTEDDFLSFIVTKFYEKIANEMVDGQVPIRVFIGVNLRLHKDKIILIAKRLGIKFVEGKKGAVD